MGLSKTSVGRRAACTEFAVVKERETDRVIALAGNPNVGKSTVFNALTGLRQHTGNWPGKTVVNAQGRCEHEGNGYMLVDLPGCYSLGAYSAEEVVARDFLCFGNPDAVIVVCDATCLERNLNLVLQTMELTPHVVVCVNLMDEARKKSIAVDLRRLSDMLGVPVVGTDARSNKGLDALMEKVEESLRDPAPRMRAKIEYPSYIEKGLTMLEPVVRDCCGTPEDARWQALKILEGDDALLRGAGRRLDAEPGTLLQIAELRRQFYDGLRRENISGGGVTDDIVGTLMAAAEAVYRETVTVREVAYHQRDGKIDALLTGKWVGIPLMFLGLLVIFWLTLSGANYPSQILSDGLFWVEGRLLDFFAALGTPPFLYEMLVLGVYRVLAWVVSVMLPPMAIFFPLFTLLEDVGYLPRVAFNLDKCFQKCRACGKQALTMCMGFGCNAAGVVGCRIIDSPRERLIAVITNNFVPCNGRFPTLVAILSMFFVGASAGWGGSVFSALLLTVVIVFGVVMTFAVSKLLSRTVLKGIPSSFTLELPPYRKPQVGRVIVRSLFDRTLFVLGRAAVVAAPAGLVIWLLANVSAGGVTLLSRCAGFLDPFGRLLGMDGVILLAFILGFPANEIVVPIIIMAYMTTGNIFEIKDLSILRQLLVDNGWTWVTAVSVMLFSLMHWPCSTTLITIRKETQSARWTAAAFAVPTMAGVVLCFAFSHIAKLFG